MMVFFRLEAWNHGIVPQKFLRQIPDFRPSLACDVREVPRRCRWERLKAKAAAIATGLLKPGVTRVMGFLWLVPSSE